MAVPTHAVMAEIGAKREADMRPQVEKVVGQYTRGLLTVADLLMVLIEIESTTPWPEDMPSCC